MVAALTRTWWPATFAAAALSPRARKLIAAAVIASYAEEWHGQAATVGFAGWCSLRLLDDLAYGAGMWAGCIRHRTIAPLLPDLHGLPGLRRRL
jgi:hypothetical protein